MLALLFGLSHTDYATRVIQRAPWQVPPSSSLSQEAVIGCADPPGIHGATIVVDGALMLYQGQGA